MAVRPAASKDSPPPVFDRSWVPIQITSPCQIDRDAERGYVPLDVRSPVDETVIATMLRLPWRLRENGEYQVHVSSLPTLVRQRFVSIDPAVCSDAVLSAVRGYLAEARRSFSRAFLTSRPPNAGDFLHLLNVGPLGPYKPRDYQLAGMAALYARGVNPALMGCVLADDVGLGKTVQVIGLVLRLIADGRITQSNPFVVSTTASTVTQWAAEFERFSRRPPALSVVSGTGSEKVRAIEKRAEVVVLNHELVRLPRYAEAIEGLAERIGGIAIDESSAIANPASKTHQALFSLSRRARYRYCLNATPIENALQDYYAQLRLINSRVVGEPEGFEGRYIERSPDGRIVGARNVREFTHRTSALYIRRTAEMVGEQLPSLLPSLRQVVMGRVQAEAYDRAIRRCFAVGRGESGVMTVENVSAVQRAALVADLKDLNSPSAKLEDLANLIRTELRGRRVLIFTRLETVAAYVVRRFHQLRPFLITGSVSRARRDAIRAEFSSAPLTPGCLPPVLVGTDAISKGLNLQAASVVVNLDLPWNPAKLRQRVGRVHRIGQDRPCLVINYRAVHPSRKRDVDRFFLSIISKKQGIVDSVFGADSIDVVGEGSEIAVARSALSYLARK